LNYFMKKSYLLSLGIFIVIFLFLVSEILSPYNFLKNDNASQFLPVILEGMSQLFSGDFPSINLHQLMGSPIFEVGTYAIFYPVTIISYVFVHYIFGNDFLLFEVFTLIHFILGFLAMFMFVFYKTKDNFISFISSIAFVFSGIFLSLCSFWYYVSPVIVFLPLILYLNDRMMGGKFKWIMLLGISRGVLFYAGNAQFFAFVVFFEFLYFMLNRYQEDWKRFVSHFVNYFLSFILTLAIMFPLLLSQFSVLSNSSRGDIPFISYAISEPVNPLEFIVGSLLPSFISGSFDLFKRFGPLHCAGIIFFISFVIFGARLIWKYKKSSLKEVDSTFWCGIVSAVLSFGLIGGFYLIGAVLPIVKNFRGPYKLVVITVFFVVAFGAIEISKFMKRRNFGKLKEFFLVLLFVIVFLNSIGNVIYFSTSFSLDEFQERNVNMIGGFVGGLNLSEGRIVSVITGSNYSPKSIGDERGATEYPDWILIRKNYATYGSLNHLSGYEPFKDSLTSEKIPISAGGVFDKTLNISSLEEYGVNYIVIARGGVEFHPELRNLSKHYSDENVIIYETRNPKGIVFSDGGDIDYIELSNGVNFLTDFSEGKNVTVNLLCKKNYIAQIDGKTGKILCDSFGRINIYVPEGGVGVKVVYVNREFYGGVIISIILFTYFIYLLLNRRKINNFVGRIWNKIPRRKIFKRKLLIFVILIFVFGGAIFLQVSDDKNIEKFIESRTGLDAEIEEVKLNPFTGRIVLGNVDLFRLYKKIFSSRVVVLDVSYINSIESSFREKSPQVILDLEVREVIFFVKVKRDSGGDCSNHLNLSIPEGFFEEYETVELRRNFSTKIKIIPFSKAFFEFSGMELLRDGEKIFVDGDIRFERYLSGEIKFVDGDLRLEEEKSCILFPLSEKGPLFKD